MTQVHFTRENVEQGVAKMLTERGEDFVYLTPEGLPGNDSVDSCLYAHVGPEGEDVPGCAVGYLAFQVAGVVPTDWDEVGSVNSLRAGGKITTDSDWTAIFLSRLQFGQDQGWAYGDAVTAARQSADDAAE